MNKRLVVLSLVLLSMIMLVSIPSAFAQADDVEKKFWEKAISIGNLEFLTGEADAESKVIGFVRLLLAIAMGFLFYALASAFRNYIPEKLGMGIAVVLAILTVIGIPPEIIALIISTYSAAASFILLGVVLGPLIYFIFFTPTHGRAMAGLKLFVLAVAAFLFGSINYFLKELKVITGEETWLLFIAWAETFAVWVFIVFIIMGLYLLWKLFGKNVEGFVSERRRAAAEAEVRGVAGTAPAATPTTRKAKKAAKKVRKVAKKVKVATLNEYIKEKEELEALGEVKKAVEEYITTIVKIINSGNVSKAYWKDIVTKKQEDLVKSTNEAVKRFIDGVEKRTYKQRREANKLIKELIDGNFIDDDKVRELNSLLSSIIVKHKESHNKIENFKKKNLSLVNSMFDKIKGVVENSSTANVSLDTPVPGRKMPGSETRFSTPIKTKLGRMKAALTSFISESGDITKAINAEAEAIKMLEGFVADIEKYWKE